MRFMKPCANNRWTEESRQVTWLCGHYRFCRVSLKDHRLLIPQYEHSLLWCNPTAGIRRLLNGEPKLAAKDAAGNIFAGADIFDLMMRFSKCRM